MKTFLFLFLSTVLFFSVSAFSQDEEKAAAISAPMNDPCDMGYIFSMKKDFTIGKVNLVSLPQPPSTGTATMNYRDALTPALYIEKYINQYRSIRGGLSFLLDNSSQDFTGGGTRDDNLTKVALELGYNFYPYGWEAPSRISPFYSPFINVGYYSNSITDKPSVGSETKNKFSGLVVGAGLSGGVWWRVSDSYKIDIGANYNAAFDFYPTSTLTTTGTNAQSVDTDGPSRWVFSNCMNFNVRASF